MTDSRPTNNGKKIGVVGCKHTTRDLIAGLMRYGFRVDHCITISPEKAEKAEVAGYMDLSGFLNERGIPFTVTNTYHLKDDDDRATLLALGLDGLLVAGWQRLIPEYFLESLSIGAFGMHGSSKPLPYGRGRSPMNWSLIQGKQTFFTHLFKYMPGVDDGPIAGMQTFEITDYDDAHTLHLKNLVAMIQLCRNTLPALLDGSAVFTPQPKEGETFYPKRSAEDGLLHWIDSTSDIFRLIRAVARPFPGAFTFLNDDPAQKITIWRAIPFDRYLSWPDATAGQILDVFYDGSFVVKTGDSTMLVQDYDGIALNETHIGHHLTTAAHPRKIWDNVPL